jgi:bacillithiol synthase
MVHGIPLRELSSSSHLLTDFWEARQDIRSLVPRHFREESALDEQARLLRAAHYDRPTVSAVLREQNERFGAGPRARERIDRLADPSSLVVIGGQQAGLFGGPLYTIHKALTILSLARRYEEQLGCPVIPVFWIASEDSDLAEIDHAYILDKEGLLRELRMPGLPQAKIPVSRVRLGDGLSPLFEELAAHLPDGGYREQTISDLRMAYTPGRTYPQAFGAWMAHLFQDQGLVIVDPSDDRLKRLALPLFKREIEEKSPVTEAVLEQTDRLVHAGYHPQIELRRGFLTLFHQDPTRDAIIVSERGFELKSSGRRFAAQELASLIAESPGSFTPNATLRPLFQDTIFPTLAVVLGPAELAYFSQLTLAYQRMGIIMPLMFPRASLTLVDAKIDALRARLDVRLEEVMERGEHIIDDVLKRQVPASLDKRIGDGRVAVADTWRGIVSEIDALDPTLHRTAVLGSARALRQFDFIEKKIAQAARRKNTLLRAQVQRLASALAPKGKLQERVLCALPFLSRYGTRIIATAAEAVDPFAPEHRAVVVNP